MLKPHKTYDLVSEAKELAKYSLENIADAADISSEFPAAEYAKTAAAGMVGIALPEAYGGSDLPVKKQVEIIAALANGCAAIVGAVIGNGIQAGLSILYGGSEELRGKMLPDLISGKQQIAFAITEETAGSDVAAMQCQAIKVNSGWIINGKKLMINRYNLSDFAVVFASTDPKLLGQGISAFLIDLKQSGITLGPTLNKMGQRGLPTGCINFNQAFVPDSNLLGQHNQGFDLMKQVINKARTLVAANAVGRMEAALKFSISHISIRSQFGQKLSDMPVVRSQIAEMGAATESARLLTKLAAESIDLKLDSENINSAMAKWVATDTCINVCKQAMLLCGGTGYTDKFPVERMMRDAMAGQIVDGSNPVQKQLVARLILKNYGL